SRITDPLLYITLLFFFYSYLHHRDLHSFPTRRSSDLKIRELAAKQGGSIRDSSFSRDPNGREYADVALRVPMQNYNLLMQSLGRSEEHTSELQSRENLVCRLLLEKKKIKKDTTTNTLT